MHCDNDKSSRISKTLVSNTGSESGSSSNKHSLGEGLEVSLDYFRGTVWLPSQSGVEELVGGLMRLLGDEPIWEYNQGSFNGIQWAHRGRSVKGVKWWFNILGGSHSKAHLLISMSGSVMKQIAVKDFWQFCKNVLVSLGFSVTRIDIAIDDYFKRITEEDVREASINRKFAIAKQVTPIQTYKHSTEPGTVQGFTYYFGSRSSDNFARFYDKGVESNGEIDSHRLEGQFRKEKAHLIWLKWLGIPDDKFDGISPQFLSGSVLGLVEFVDRISRNDKRKVNIRDCKRLPWWQKFIDACGNHIRHSVPREDTTLEKAKKWLEKQVLPMMAVIQKAMGLLEFRGWLDENLAQKAANFTKEQAAKVVQWSKGESNILQRTNGAVDSIDEEGTKWIWVYRQANGFGWGRARFLNSNGTTVRARFSGEKAISVPRRACHFGEEEPTWKPQAVAELVKSWAMQT